MATYALNLDTDGRILSISQYFQEIPAGVTTVDTIPDGNCGDWLYKNGVYVYDPIINLPVEKAAKHNIISNTCANTIESGIDVTTSVGKEHFSLTTKDQLDLTNQVAIAKSGSATVYYHADGALCRAFTAEEIISVGMAAIAYVTYNTSLANHLFAWIDRCTTKDELNKITYSPDDLPEDLFANFAKITGYTKPVVTETPTETTTTPNTAVDTTTTNTTTPSDTTTTNTSDATTPTASDTTTTNTTTPDTTTTNTSDTTTANTSDTTTSPTDSTPTETTTTPNAAVDTTTTNTTTPDTTTTDTSSAESGT